MNLSFLFLFYSFSQTTLGEKKKKTLGIEMFCVAITVYSSAKDKEQNGLDLDAVWEIP